MGGQGQKKGAWGNNVKQCGNKTLSLLLTRRKLDFCRNERELVEKLWPKNWVNCVPRFSENGKSHLLFMALLTTGIY